MQLIHEQKTKAFRQAIWFDEETELYYEVIKGARESHIEVYMGTELAKSSDKDQLYFYENNGRATPIDKVIAYGNNSHSANFNIPKGTRWQSIKDQVLSFATRIPL